MRACLLGLGSVCIEHCIVCRPMHAECEAGHATRGRFVWVGVQAVGCRRRPVAMFGLLGDRACAALRWWRWWWGGC